MILIIDNYDSFTYNLVQYIGELCIQYRDISQPVKVYRNDKITIKEIKLLKPTCIVISPGPCTPNEAGISVEVVRKFYNKIPILGVCLGHQCIVQAFGGKIVRAKRVVHGKTSKIYHDGKTIYRDIENPFVATRYHSLVADRNSLPITLEVSSWTKDEIIMGVRLKDKRYILEGVQFHPESILTTFGKKLLLNFLRLSIHKK
ncbi:MAG: aminodeoxychorismate/anthranilate synthase component II [Endomicrobia bacterium]|nr:aminodeoxychorismate/anthranilate synthase component II [Endomicrobiia bacterium]MCX7941297.1 aminodeoxychorismate/anthranilate synthase component II [Endomicrobiia bacterium]MDW8055943.1 aminodeoxychorismate/anthranilate synthase component II [Elusimicrobiota bacterium]